jgi:replicative DNA helicase
MVDLDNASKPIDQVTVAEQMRASDTFKALRAFNGDSYFAELTNAVVTVENIAFHAKIVRGKATVRRLIEAAQEIAARGYGDYGDVDEFIDEAERAIFEIAQRSQRSSYEPIPEDSRRRHQGRSRSATTASRRSPACRRATPSSTR